MGESCFSVNPIFLHSSFTHTCDSYEARKEASVIPMMIFFVNVYIKMNAMHRRLYKSSVVTILI